jgi:hypothetical protein
MDESVRFIKKRIITIDCQQFFLVKDLHTPLLLLPTSGTGAKKVFRAVKTQKSLCNF